MALLEQILGGGVGQLFKDVVGSFKLSPAAKQEFETQLEANQQALRLKEFELEEKALAATQTVVDAQKAIVVAEMGQEDKFTKRARPMLVYCGLGFIFLSSVFLPMYAFFGNRPIPSIALPEEFWWAWTGVVGIWSIGRDAVRRGHKSKVAKTITGNK